MATDITNITPIGREFDEVQATMAPLRQIFDILLECQIVAKVDRVATT